jgi:hypothetical protein
MDSAMLGLVFPLGCEQDFAAPVIYWITRLLGFKPAALTL